MNKEGHTTTTPYADTAYAGKANPYFRENIAPPEERKRHLAKGQCKMGVFPRVKITGICWDNRQKLGDHLGLKDRVQDVDKMLNLKPMQLRLALFSQSQNTKEVIVFSWMFLHVCAVVTLPFFMLVGLILGGWANVMGNLDVLIIGGGSILASKYIFRFVDKLGWMPTGQYVIFNRQTGMIEIANDDRNGYHYLPFEEFNAHHRTVHSERGAPSYGFTLLHYKHDLMYQIAEYPRVIDALVHWELIKNFMDSSEPLADIPQFERYRAYDPTTAAYDKKHGRPDNFWRRVDKKFMKSVASIASKSVYGFPEKTADTLQSALKQGYNVPDIIRFPWREADNISDQFLFNNPNWFIRYVCSPLIP